MNDTENDDDRAFEAACQEARRLDTINCRTVLAGAVRGVCTDPDGEFPDAVLADRDALFVLPERLYPLHNRRYWDEAYSTEVGKTDWDTAQGYEPATPEEITEQRRRHVKRRAAFNAQQGEQ